MGLSGSTTTSPTTVVQKVLYYYSELNRYWVGFSDVSNAEMLNICNSNNSNIQYNNKVI